MCVCRQGANSNECTYSDIWQARTVEALKKVALHDAELHLSLFKELHLISEKDVSIVKRCKQGITIGPKFAMQLLNDFASTQPF